MDWLLKAYVTVAIGVLLWRGTEGDDFLSSFFYAVAWPAYPTVMIYLLLKERPWRRGKE